MENTEMPLDSSQPSTSNQPTQRESKKYEVPYAGRANKYANKKNLPQNFTYDYATVDGPLKNDRVPRGKPNRANVIELPNTEKGEIYTGGYVIAKLGTMEVDAHDGGYVIEKPDTAEQGSHDGDYVIERLDTGEEGSHDGGYVIKK